MFCYLQLFGLYIEYIKHFANIFTQFNTFKSEYDIVRDKLDKQFDAGTKLPQDAKGQVQAWASASSNDR